ncbi:MAG: serine/threonine-protein kinase, partial [Planctomycetota bacterium]
AGLEAMPEDLRTLPDKELAERLIADDTLTRWQADKLLAGKYKGFKLGKYKLLGLIGKGGMSAVYLGEHAVMRRRSAIKVLPSARVDDASYLGRFHREAEAIASLNHNNIVRAYDVDVEQTRNQEIHFLAMEYVDGPPLSEVVTDRGLLTFAETVEIVRQTCEGLDHAHAAGLVHRDIKPSNLLVDREGVVKILDLGLARFFDEGDDTGSLTVAHDERVLGTADYLAPEQAVDSHTVDERADLYSLGCTCYYLLTGAPPFTDQSLAKRLLAHQTRTPEPLRARRPDTPDSVERLVERMMEKKADDRFASARELAEACEQWLADNHPHAPVALRGLNDVKFLERQKITLEAVSEPGSESHLAGSSTLGGRVPGAGRHEHGVPESAQRLGHLDHRRRRRHRPRPQRQIVARRHEQRGRTHDDQ